jgi:hypothetical protein
VSEIPSGPWPSSAYADCPNCGERVLNSWNAWTLHIRECHLPDSVDAAWAEAEAALPKGGIHLHSPGGNPRVYWAEGIDPRRMISASEMGPTPAAALRALTAKLREVAK